MSLGVYHLCLRGPIGCEARDPFDGGLPDSFRCERARRPLQCGIDDAIEGRTHPVGDPSARRRWRMTCPSCGTANPADFMFCLQCGQRLSAAEPDAEDLAETRAEMLPPDDLNATRADLGPEPRSPAPLRLRVEQGSVDEQVITLDRPETVIGRRKGSDIVIYDTN